MVDLAQRIRARLEDWNFKDLFQRGLGWSAASRFGRQAAAAVEGRCLAVRGASAVVEIPYTAWPSRRRRQQIYQQLRRQIADPLVIWMSCDRSRCLWVWDSGQLPLIRHQASLPTTQIARLRADAQPPWATVALALTPVATAPDPDLAAAIAALEAGLQGIPRPERDHYAVILFCRLVALAALQQRGLLDGDEWYLQNQFGRSQQQGPDRFFGAVLQPLWFQGLTLPPHERPRGLQYLGDIPYLAPGLFQRTDLEQDWGPVSLPDRAFEPLLSWLGDLALAHGDLAEALKPLLEGWVNQQRGWPFITPAALVETLCDRTLSPLLLERGCSLVHQPCDSVADLLMVVSPQQGAELLAAMLSLTWLDPACGSGRYLLAMLERFETVLSALMAIAAAGSRPVPSPLADGPAPLALRRHLLNHMGFGIDLWPEAVEIARLQIWLWLLRDMDSVDWLVQLPDARMNVLTGNALIGLVTVDSERFDPMPPRGAGEAQGVYQGNLLQPLLAEDYDTVLRERQIYLEHYRSQTHLLTEIDGVPGYVQAEFLSERLQALNQAAQNKLNRLLLNELSRQLGLRYCYRDAAGKRQRRLLTGEDVATLRPFHWGFHFHNIIRQGGFDLILTHAPAGALKPTHQAEVAFLNDCFRRLESYQHATQPAGQRQMRVYWERLYLERTVQLLKPGGRATLVMPAGFWHQGNAAHLRTWLYQAVGIDLILELSNHNGALGDLPPATTLSLVSFVKDRSAEVPEPTVWSGPEAPTPATLGAYLQGSVDLAVEPLATSRVI